MDYLNRGLGSTARAGFKTGLAVYLGELEQQKGVAITAVLALPRPMTDMLIFHPNFV